MELEKVLFFVAQAVAILAGLCWLYQTVYLLVSLRRPRNTLPATERKRRYGILIAARNEETVLPYLLQSIRQQDYPQQLLRIFVVADNCTDHTARVAQEGGAQVWRRYSKEQVGKGYALQFLLDQMERGGHMEGLDAFLVFDADNLLVPDYISQMDRLPDAGFDAFCGYRNTKNFGDSWVSMGNALWFLHDSLHLNGSRMALGVSCAVSGTGFGFTKALLERMGGWSFFCLTEDIQFDTWCAVNGVKIGFCREAMVYDEQPVTFQQSWKQRIRWVQGGIQVSFRYGGPLVRGIFRGGRGGWACFETLTLSLWGYLLSILGTGCGLLTAWAAFGPAGMGAAALGALSGMVLWLFALGALTVYQAWNQIQASAGKKLAAMAVFPLFMLTFAPVAIWAVFARRGWAPIRHTVAVPLSRLKVR